MAAAARWARALGLALGLWAGGARADVKMTVASLLGSEVVANDGWTSFVVRMESTEKAPIKGRLVGQGEGAMQRSRSEAPVTLLPGTTAVVRVPLQLVNGWSAQFELLDESGRPLAHESVYVRGRRDPLLVDLHSPSRIVSVLRGASVAAAYEAEPHSGRSTLSLALGAAMVDPASGDALVPQHAAEWGAATLVLAPSDTLARLGGPEQEALASYVLGGGTLAVVVRRPEDLRQGFLPQLLGGEAHDGGPAKQLRRLALPQPPLSSGKSNSEDAPAGMVVPGREVAEGLVSYSGGNLRASDFGASAPYGLGEVHLLAFDPEKTPEVSDPWVQAQLLELTRHAWDRRAFLVLPPGGSFAEERGNLGPVRRQLDPNESARWAVVVAALLLVIYAAVAGPVNFLLAARSGRPLRALVVLPVLSALVFSAVVVLAVATKGWSGESRRLSLVEAGGGMSAGVIRRYRGFFTPVAQQVTVAASSDQGMPAVVEESSGRPLLWVDRGGLELRQLDVMPWQTMVVREDDVARLGGGVALVPNGDGTVQVVNRLGRDLRGVLVHVPGRGIFHLPALRDGASAQVGDGTRVVAAPLASSRGGSSFRVRHLNLGPFHAALEPTPGLSDAWEAVNAVVGSRPTDWWPEGQPALLAQVDGGEGVRRDQGLPLTRDRMLLRVVGYGGTP